MFEKAEETKVHVLIDLSGRIARKDGQIVSKKDGYWAGWRRGGDGVFLLMYPHIPRYYKRVIPLRNKTFLGLGHAPVKISLGMITLGPLHFDYPPTIE